MISLLMRKNAVLPDGKKLVQEWQNKTCKHGVRHSKWGKKKRKFHSGISMTTMLLPLLFWFYVCGI